MELSVCLQIRQTGKAGVKRLSAYFEVSPGVHLRRLVVPAKNEGLVELLHTCTPVTSFVL